MKMLFFSVRATGANPFVSFPYEIFARGIDGDEVLFDFYRQIWVPNNEIIEDNYIASHGYTRAEIKNGTERKAASPVNVSSNLMSLLLEHTSDGRRFVLSGFNNAAVGNKLLMKLFRFGGVHEDIKKVISSGHMDIIPFCKYLLFSYGVDEKFALKECCMAANVNTEGLDPAQVKDEVLIHIELWYALVSIMQITPDHP